VVIAGRGQLMLSYTSAPETWPHTTETVRRKGLAWQWCTTECLSATQAASGVPALMRANSTCALPPAQRAAQAVQLACPCRTHAGLLAPARMRPHLPRRLVPAALSCGGQSRAAPPPARPAALRHPQAWVQALHACARGTCFYVRA